MIILMLSTDENILKEGSESQKRMIDYGGLVEELHIIVFTKRNYQLPITNYQQNSKFQISKNVRIYSTNTWFRPLYFFDAYRIGRRVIENCKLKIENWVVTTQDPFETGLVGCWLKKKYKLPLQIQVHADFLSPHFWRESLKNKIRVLVAQRLVKKADGIRVVSERIKNLLLSLYPKPYTLNPISVLPIFVDVEKIKNSPVRIDLHQKYPGRFIILMASRLTREKNIPMALEAIRGLTRNNTRINAEKILLLIVGDGTELEKLKLLTTHYSLQTDVVFEPWTDDLPSYYKTADLFLLTSNYEGYGRTVVEAAAAGLPVLMTDVGVAIGSVVPVGDREVLAGHLELLVGNRLEREGILEGQRRNLEFYRSKEDYLKQLKQSWLNCFS
ncbi:MAG: glycosyltransferase family 4 protein [Parcubacteria group bacterium]|nr:glycosyltransferase family 4 protein [Parcubacteria group bacterium]